ncbi:MAG: glycosyltransferase family 1 protein [Pseudomonadota bacterium]
MTAGLRLLIGADALAASPRTGVGHYTGHLVDALRQQPEVAELWAWIHLGIRREGAGGRENPVPARGGLVDRLRQPLSRLPLASAGHEGLKNWLFWWHSRRLAPMLYHETNFILKPFFRGVAVATLHDLSWRHFPDFHPASRRRWLERGISRTLRDAALIMTPSEFIRREVVADLGVPASQTWVTPLGVDAVFHPRSPGQLAAPLATWGLTPGGYLLVVATREPRKNLERLILAYGRLPEALQRHYPLVLAGANGWRAESLERTLTGLERTGRLRVLGYVVDADLPFLYAGAAAFAFPSLYEGFGLPPLEAMASGIPVLTSRDSAMTEVAGEVALRVDPYDLDQITEGLRQLLEDDGLKRQALDQGPRQARPFTWENTARLTLAGYRQVIE